MIGKAKTGEGAMANRGMFMGAAVAAAAVMFAAGASAQDAKHYRFAHDQQLNSGYSVAFDIFSAKLKELSGGKMLVDQYPGASLAKCQEIHSAVDPALVNLKSAVAQSDHR